MKRLRWLLWLGGAFVSVYLTIWGILESLAFFDLFPWHRDANGFLILFVISYLIALTAATCKAIPVEPEHRTQQSLTDFMRPDMLRYELEPISNQMRILCASIFELPMFADFLESNEFARLCETYNLEKHWQSIKDKVHKKSGASSTTSRLPLPTDTFYNFINLLYKNSQDSSSEFNSLSVFVSRLLTKYKEKYPGGDISRPQITLLYLTNQLNENE